MQGWLRAPVFRQLVRATARPRRRRLES